MSNTSFNFRALACLAVLCGLAIGNANASLADSLPTPYPQTTLEKTVNIASSGHLVLFSPVREINNEIRSDTMARLPVRGEGRLYQIARDASRERARDHYLRQLADRGARILFECTGVQCGRSNVWANQIFGEAVLYGRDDAQNYLVAGTVEEDGTRWLTLVYTVTRGNLREYVWVEHLEVTSDAPVPGLGTMNRRIIGPFIVPWRGGVTYNFDWTATERRQVTNLASEQGSRVVLVGYSELRPEEPLASAMDRASGAVQSMSEILSKTGVPRDQQEWVIVGPTLVFESPDRRGNRIEVMVIRR